MQQNFNINLLYPKAIDWDEWRNYRPDSIFSDEVIEYLSTLSSNLLKDKESRLYPDVITFAFFCRKGNLISLKRQYESDELRQGRGVLFHIAPSNVPINFGYSMVAGLLSGNYNVVRVSSKEFPQVDLIIRHMNRLKVDKIANVAADRIALVRYDRTSDATDFFSSFCDVRIIWGGDATIAKIRQSAIPARSFDITFADRYSIAAINSAEMSTTDDNTIASLAEGFYNDTYLFDQNACSAPHLVVWVGSKSDTQKAKFRFWNALQQLVDKKYKLQTVLTVDKLTAFYRQAIVMSIERQDTPQNNLIRVKLNTLGSNIDECRCAGGYFSEFNADNLTEITPIVKSKYQTLAYFGFSNEELTNFVERNRVRGIDRIVPFGHTTDFSLKWDGYDLIKGLTRIIQII